MVSNAISTFNRARNGASIQHMIARVCDQDIKYWCLIAGKRNAVRRIYLQVWRRRRNQFPKYAEEDASADKTDEYPWSILIEDMTRAGNEWLRHKICACK
jgi:hypothetical protein